jgi:GT2 family glycosyltransferase
MEAYTVTISVVTYNSEAHIGALLGSIARHVQPGGFHVYVIDNGSADRTEEIVKAPGYPFVTWVQSGRNLGFGGGHNLVLGRLDSRYHLCVNPDITLNGDVVSAMARYLDTHGDIGIFNAEDPERRRELAAAS